MNPLNTNNTLRTQLLEEFIRENGVILTHPPVEIDPPLHWYGVKVGRILGLFKRQYVVMLLKNFHTY